MSSHLPRRLGIVITVGALIASLSACTDGNIDGPEFTTADESGKGVSFESSPAADYMVSDGQVSIESTSGESAGTYTLGTVDTSTYKTEGLSYVSDDEGWVDGAASGSGSGRTMIFFIDGVQAQQPVTVALIDTINVHDQNSLSVIYKARHAGASEDDTVTVTYTLRGGEVDVTGETDIAGGSTLWNTDIPFESTGDSSATAAEPSPTVAASDSEAGSSSGDLTTMSEVTSSGHVEYGSMVSMVTNDGTEIRCLTENIGRCFTRNPYWSIDGQKVNYVDLKTGEGNVSDLGQGWSSSATRIEKGTRYELQGSIMGMADLGYFGWDGENVVSGPLPPDSLYKILTPSDGIVTMK